MMQKILIIFAHPASHKSKINRRLIEGLKTMDGITICDLYEKYPDFFINVKHEQRQLIENDIIIWHHPLYWYSCPALLKEWLDLVLEHGFAYGRNGTKLHGKKILNVVTTGGDSSAYNHPGKNQYSIKQLLAPFHQTALLCGMQYLPPFVVHGAHKYDSVKVRLDITKYQQIITGLRDNVFNEESIASCNYLNELITGE